MNQICSRIRTFCGNCNYIFFFSIVLIPPHHPHYINLLVMVIYRKVTLDVQNNRYLKNHFNLKVQHVKLSRI